MSEEAQKLGGPMEIEKTQKLKIYSIVSVKKDVDLAPLKDSFSITLVASYSMPEAFAGCNAGLTATGRNPEDYLIGFMRIEVEADQLIAIQKQPSAVNVDTGVEAPLQEVSLGKVELEEEMIKNVERIFTLVGSKEQQRVSRLVIEKFREYVEKNKLSIPIPS